jgi:hypothetical protein
MANKTLVFVGKVLVLSIFILASINHITDPKPYSTKIK